MPLLSLPAEINPSRSSVDRHDPITALWMPSLHGYTCAAQDPA